jgi:hypothetical protein
MSSPGQMDMRLPMGIMFCIIGLMIGLYGLFTMGSPMYVQHSLGIDINLWWGLVLLLFGLAMLGLVWRAGRSRSNVT